MQPIKASSADRWGLMPTLPPSASAGKRGGWSRNGCRADRSRGWLALRNPSAGNIIIHMTRRKQKFRFNNGIHTYSWKGGGKRERAGVCDRVAGRGSAAGLVHAIPAGNVPPAGNAVLAGDAAQQAGRTFPAPPKGTGRDPACGGRLLRQRWSAGSELADSEQAAGTAFRRMRSGTSGAVASAIAPAPIW